VSRLAQPDAARGGPTRTAVSRPHAADLCTYAARGVWVGADVGEAGEEDFSRGGKMGETGAGRGVGVCTSMDGVGCSGCILRSLP